MSRRSGILEFAVLGLLREAPMHGYELSKRLNTSLGIFRAFSYGSLYPCLKSLVQRGWLTTEAGSPSAELLAAPLAGRRAKIVYRLTAEGKEHFEELLAQSGPDAWEDEHFGVRFAFFGQTSRDVRMRVLEGRRSRLEERLARMRASLARTRERMDDYNLELQRHGMESVEREVRWLNELIESERSGREQRRAQEPRNRSDGQAQSDDQARSDDQAPSDDEDRSSGGQGKSSDDQNRSDDQLARSSDQAARSSDRTPSSDPAPSEDREPGPQGAEGPYGPEGMQNPGSPEGTGGPSRLGNPRPDPSDDTNK